MFTTPANHALSTWPGLGPTGDLNVRRAPAAPGSPGSPGSPGASGSGAGDFAARLDRARSGSSAGGTAASPDSPVPADAQAAREAAEQFVASALILPMLQRMQSDPLRSDLFKSPHQDAFQSQMNVHLADRIVSRSNLPVVDWIANQVLSREQRAPQAGSIAQPATPLTPTTSSDVQKETRP